MDVSSFSLWVSECKAVIFLSMGNTISGKSISERSGGEGTGSEHGCVGAAQGASWGRYTSALSILLLGVTLALVIL